MPLLSFCTGEAGHSVVTYVDTPRRRLEDAGGQPGDTVGHRQLYLGRL